MGFLQDILLALTAIGALYYAFSTIALVFHFCRQAKILTPYAGGSEIPPEQISYAAKISVLKPICGIDPELESNLTTFLTQDHPSCEVLFGVLDDNDPALPILRKFTTATVHTGSAITGSNNKVRILHSLAKQASGDILVITDADTRAAPDFLREITAPFAEDRIGAVTCLYRGVNARTIADSLEALHMTCVFAPGVASHNIKGIDFGLGAAIAVRKTALEKAGGFAELTDYLADDFALGRIISKAGYKVILSNYVIEITLGGESLPNVLKRELRWSVTTRISRPWGHLGLVFTFGFTYALAFLAASGFSKRGWLVLWSVMLLRLITAWLGARICLNDREFPRAAYLLPLRDIISFAIWVAGYFTRSVNWRGRRLIITKQGKVKADM